MNLSRPVIQVKLNFCHVWPTFYLLFLQLLPFSKILFSWLFSPVFCDIDLTGLYNSWLDNGNPSGRKRKIVEYSSYDYFFNILDNVPIFPYYVYHV